VRWRSSVRRYDADRPVPEEALRGILECARLAPSADNSQPWRFVVVVDPAARDRLARACFSGIYFPTRFAAAAPVILALCADRARVLERAGETILRTALHLLDCGIAGEHVVLAAAERGLGTCWIGWFDKAAAKRVLGVPAHVDLIALIAMGYPRRDAGPRQPRREPLSRIAFRDHWGAAFIPPGED
jgi:nitroreductase